MRSQVHETTLYFSKDLRIKIFISSLYYSCQCLESQGHEIKIIIIAIVENGNDTADDGFFEHLSV